MTPIFKFFVRATLIFLIFLFYLNYRNNQCINNQNCKPFFISHYLSFKKNYKNAYPIIYKINDNLPNIDVITEPSFSKEIGFKRNFKKEEIDNFITLLSYLKNYGLSDIDFVKNNDIIVKKISFINTSKTPAIVYPKMTFNNNIFKIYNCFCDTKIIINPMSIKDVFIYFELKEPKEENLKDAKDFFEKDDFVIKVSI